MTKADAVSGVCPAKSRIIVLFSSSAGSHFSLGFLIGCARTACDSSEQEATQPNHGIPGCSAARLGESSHVRSMLAGFLHAITDRRCRWLIDVENVKFWTDDLFSRVPKSWREALLAAETTELQRLPLGHTNVRACPV